MRFERGIEIMNRRDVLKTGLAAGVVSGSQIAAHAADAALVATAEAQHFYELRTYQLRNDLQPARVSKFFVRGKHSTL